MFSFFRKAKIWQCDLSKGISQAEKSAREFSNDKKILAQNLNILAKETFSTNPYESIAFMKESDVLVPSASKKKWIGFRLFDKGMHEEAYQILSVLDENIFKSDSEIKKLKIVKAKHICDEKDLAISIKKVEVVSVQNGSNAHWVDSLIGKQSSSIGQNYYTKLPLTIGLIAPENFNDIDENVIDVQSLSPNIIVDIENNKLNAIENIDVFVFVASLSGKYKDWSEYNILQSDESERIISFINLLNKQNIITVFYALEDNRHFSEFYNIARSCRYIYSSVTNYLNNTVVSTNRANNSYFDNSTEICIDYPLFGIDLTEFNPFNFHNKDKSKDVVYYCSDIYDYYARESQLSSYIDALNENGRRLIVLDNMSSLGNVNVINDEVNAGNSTFSKKHNVLHLNKAYDFAAVDFKNKSITNIAKYLKMKLQGNLLLEIPSKNIINSSDYLVVPNAYELKKILSTLSDEQIYEYQISSIRKAIREYSSYDCLLKFINQIGLSSILKTRLLKNKSQCSAQYGMQNRINSDLLASEIYPVNFSRNVLVVASEITDEIQKNFERQSYSSKTLISKKDISIEFFKKYDYVTFFDNNSYYGVYYLEDMINAFKFNKCSYVTKDAYLNGENLVLGKEHNYVDHINSLYRTVFDINSLGSEYIYAIFLSNEKQFNGITNTIECNDSILHIENGYSIDHFNYISNYNELGQFKSLNCKLAENYSFDISVIIPICNNGDYLLNRCFSSLERCSNFNKLEIILVDDGSSDITTLNVERHLSDRYSNVKLYSLGGIPSGSASKPRNFGVEQASANYIIFLDPDDEVVNDGYSKLYETIIQKDRDIVVGNYLTVRNGIKYTNTYSIVSELLENNSFEHGLSNYMLKLNFPTIRLHSMLIKKDYIKSLEIKQIEGAIGEDSLFAWQLVCGDCYVDFINEYIQQYNAEISSSVSNIINVDYFEKLELIQNFKIIWLKNNNYIEYYSNNKFLSYYYNLVLRKLNLLLENTLHNNEIEEAINCVVSIYDMYLPYINNSIIQKQLDETFGEIKNFADTFAKTFSEQDIIGCRKLLSREFGCKFNKEKSLISDESSHRENCSKLDLLNNNILLTIALNITTCVSEEDLHDILCSIKRSFGCNDFVNNGKTIEILILENYQNNNTSNILDEFRITVSNEIKNAVVRRLGLINSTKQTIQNIAIQEANGKYILFSDEKVLFNEQSLNKIMNQLDNTECIKDLIIYSYDDLSSYSTTNRSWTHKGLPNSFTVVKNGNELKITTKEDLCNECSNFIFNKVYRIDFIKNNHLVFKNFGILYSDKLFNLQHYFITNNIYVSNIDLLSYKFANFDNDNKYALKFDTLGFENFVNAYKFAYDFINKKHNIDKEDNNLYLLKKLFNSEYNNLLVSSVFNKHLVEHSIKNNFSELVEHNQEISLDNGSKPTISVVMPVFKAYKFLESTLQSVLSQTYTNLEILCIEDCSPDNTLQLLKYYQKKDKRIKIIANEENRGAGYCRNVGIENLTGEYCLFLDCDDWFKSEFIEKMYQKISTDHSDICFCNYTTVYCNGCEGKTTNFAENVTENPFKPADYTDCLFQINHAVPWNKIYRSDFIKQNKLKFELLSSSNDLTFTLTSFVKAKSISFLKDSLINYHLLQGRYTTKRFNDVHVDNVVKAYDKILSNLNKSETNLCLLSFLNAFEHSIEYRLSIGARPIITSYPLFMRDKNILSFVSDNHILLKNYEKLTNKRGIL